MPGFHSNKHPERARTTPILKRRRQASFGTAPVRKRRFGNWAAAPNRWQSDGTHYFTHTCLCARNDNPMRHVDPEYKANRTCFAHKTKKKMRNEAMRKSHFTRT